MSNIVKRLPLIEISQFGATMDDYLEFVREKAITKPDSILFGWENGMLGLCAEVGELANKMKKQLYQDDEIDDNEFKEELGDIFWYLIYTIDAMDFNFIDILKMNVNKLEKRYRG